MSLEVPRPHIIVESNTNNIPQFDQVFTALTAQINAESIGDPLTLLPKRAISTQTSQYNWTLTVPGHNKANEPIIVIAQVTKDQYGMKIIRTPDICYPPEDSRRYFSLEDDSVEEESSATSS